EAITKTTSSLAIGPRFEYVVLLSFSKRCECSRVAHAHSRIGYVHERPIFETRFSDCAYLSYLGELSGLWGQINSIRVTELLEQVNVHEAASRASGTYSKGMLQRPTIAQALRNTSRLRDVKCLSSGETTTYGIAQTPKRSNMTVSNRDTLTPIVPKALMVRNDRGHPGFTLIIDGKTVQAYETQTLLSVAVDNGITDIPNLCSDGKLEPAATCRMCLVSIEGTHQLFPACSTMVQPGMVVTTKSDELFHLRRTNLELILSDHNAYCQPPCQVDCPTHIDIPGYLELIARGDEKGRAPGQGSAPVPLYPGADMPCTLPEGLPSYPGRGRNRDLPHAWACR
ncbi:MAG: 2Fe-2S iron-sulfur cluster-binding protein, partial [Chloroflexota bacterium]|nr:2Fe-2S iron-sulfur cluster-binding protein [Chloroflexota bacterium]